MKRYRPKAAPGADPRGLRERPAAPGDGRAESRAAERSEGDAPDGDLTLEILDADGGSTQQRVPQPRRPDRGPDRAS